MAVPPRRGACRMRPVRRKLFRGKKNPFAIDAPLPPAGAARWATIAGLVIGGLVALSVPIFFALMLFETLRGE